jgi:sigma-B regulation protein RsbU (phosphoserine phosphatase)
LTDPGLRFGGFGLKTKFSLWLTAFILLVMAFVYVYFTTHERGVLAREIQLRGKTLDQNLVNGAKEYLTQEPVNDLLLIQLVHDTKKQNPGVVYCFVIDTTGKVWAHTDQEQINSRYLVPKRLRPLGDDSIRTQPYRMPDGMDVFEIAMPVRVGTAKIGEAHLAVSRQAIREAAAQASRGMALFTLVILAAGLAGVLTLVSLIIGSLGDLTMGIEAIGNGDLERPIVTVRQDEIGRIAQAVKTMAEKLQAARAELIEKERMRKEMQIAREIQQALIPRQMPKYPGYAIDAYYLAAMEVGGDYYDFVRVDENRFGVVIADVSGKGVAGSLVMAMTRSLLKIVATKTPFPHKAVTVLNETLTGDIPEGMFITLFYAVFDRKAETVAYCSAGHNPVYLYDFASRRLEKLKPDGPPLGIGLLTTAEFGQRLKEEKKPFKPGSTILFYTDGVTEAMNREHQQFGEERLEKLIIQHMSSKPDRFKNAIKGEVENFTGNEPQSDDITFVIVQRA